MKQCLLVIALLCSSGALAASRSGNFDRDEVGGMAAGWRAASGTWRVVAEPTAPSTGQVLAQVSSEHSGSYFNVAVADEPSLRDMTITVKYRAVAGKEDQGGGPVWRYRDLKNYYIARENPLERNFRVYRVSTDGVSNWAAPGPARGVGPGTRSRSP